MANGFVLDVSDIAAAASRAAVAALTIPYWVINPSQQRLDAMEARWASKLTDRQLSNPWQQIRLGGKALPGVWRFERMKRRLTVQSNKKSGSDGGKPTIRGVVNPEFQLHGQLYIPSHFSEWIDIARRLEVAGDPEKRQQHLLEHPMASLGGVRAVLVIGLEYLAPERGGPLGVMLDLLGVSERDGATRKPKPPNVPTAKTPIVTVTPQGNAPSVSQYVIRPPDAGR